MQSIFPVITKEKQQAFEIQATDKQREDIPIICGYYGRACRQMDDVADRALCFGCPLAEFCKD